MNTLFAGKKTLITYIGIILATVVFTLAYFSSYATVKRINYAAEFEVLPDSNNETQSEFLLIDVTDAAVCNNTGEDEQTVVSPIGIGKVPNLPDTSKAEIQLYDVLQDNDGPISEAEKEKLTEKLHWQEYVTGPNDTLAEIAKDFNIDVSALQKANCFSDKTTEVLEGTLLYIPDSVAEVDITRKYVAKQRAEAERIARERNKMHPLAYVVQKQDTPAKIARRFGLKEDTLLSANKGKKIKAGATLTIPTMNGIYVRVGRKDTIAGLANKYGGTRRGIMRANGLEGNSALRLGMKIFIPGGRVPEVYVASRTSRGKTIVIADTGADIGRFRWPCQGRVTSPFGYRRSPFRRRRTVFHAGIDIAAHRGTPVVASASGVVSHSGWMSGYGKTIIIQHGGGVSTLYGHNSALLVGVGKVVSRGQIIARVGSTGRSTGNHCHFEIRRGGRPTNPMRGLR